MTHYEPGKRQYEKNQKQEALDFAKDRVAEMWVTHFYEYGNNYVVEWWCQ